MRKAVVDPVVAGEGMETVAVIDLTVSTSPAVNERIIPRLVIA